MAKTPSFLSIFLILCFVIEKPDGLTIKIHHWDSPESPLYMGNLTHLERIQRLVHQSKARAYHLSSRPLTSNGSNAADPKGMRAGLYGQDVAVFMAQVEIGTFPAGRSSSYKSFLHVDTASELVWTQCEDCKTPPHHCYSEIEPPFPNSRSRSYHPLVCGKQSLCYPNLCTGNLCAYQRRYADGSSTSGILAYENFFFDSGPHRKQSIPLLFGCGIDNIEKVYESKQSRVGGILGLGWGPRSLINQISSQTKGKFSYCLPPYSHGGKEQISFLRFGDDITTKQGLSTTPMLTYPNEQYYYLKLRDISIQGEKLGIPEQVFARSGNGRGGCMIDSGSAISLVAIDAYATVRYTMVKYFSRFKDWKSRPGVGGFDLCYQRVGKTGKIVFPTMTLHFQGADFVIKPQALFIQLEAGGGTTFCLAMIADEEDTKLTTIGAYQQTNQLLVYDINKKVLSFGPQDCTKDE